MTEEQAILLEKLKKNFLALQEQYSALKNEHTTLLIENETLTNENTDLKNKYSELQNDHESLRISKSFSASEEEKSGMKKKIGLMVREIDKCIELLNE
jgi:regulator of replication initiation timing